MLVSKGSYTKKAFLETEGDLNTLPVHRKAGKDMETEEKRDVSQYLTVLRRAKTDNEKFAALLMVIFYCKH